MIGLGIILLILGYVLKVAMSCKRSASSCWLSVRCYGFWFRRSPGGRPALLVLTRITGKTLTKTI